MIVELRGIDVPEPWRSQGFVRLWMVDNTTVCFTRFQAEQFELTLALDAEAHSNLLSPSAIAAEAVEAVQVSDDAARL